ncbi:MULTISPECIES: hypothetical protein [unclassified Nostoc]|uniref:hypothetical protein n=1 Tax=unclassified Nostoc TaxID=2593658 RepID=UPI002AD29F1C|nr:hypothetical protein [Nostoc sp. DedQUE03]MDZ8046040.1 hypothetical protein [Nostoc sp. DedQUE02]
MILIIQSTFRKCDRKCCICTEGIVAYWILDVNQHQVYVFRKPDLESYNLEFILQEDATLSLIAFPEI